MALITSPEMFINMRSIPDKTSKEYIPFFEAEKRKCKTGVTINGVHIPPWVYWHTNHWMIDIDTIDPITNFPERTRSRPELWDNVWDIGEHVQKAQALRSGLLILGTRQFGKDLLDSSILYYKDKEGTIGDCKVGEEIYGADGKLTTITGKFPQGVKDVYEITLKDGRKINCGIDHNHYVFDTNKKKFSVITTRELIQTYKRNRTDDKFESRYFIPRNNAVQYEKKNLSIDPYFLGLWLGDGNSRNTGITTYDQEIKEYIYKIANKRKLSVYIDCADTFLITSGQRGGNDRNKNSLLLDLQKLNLIENKHIPDIYLHSSIKDRMEILRGLMDTDGCCLKNGVVEFSSSYFNLANTFYKLCRGLGILLTWTKKKGSYKKNGERIFTKEVNRFRLYTSRLIFKLPRKFENLYKGNSRKQAIENKTGIINIKFLKKDYTTCITVDNNSHLFLTDNYTTTHNSEFGASYEGWRGVCFENTQNVLAGLSSEDLSGLLLKLDRGLINVTDYFKPMRIKDEWDKEVILGYKTPQGDRKTWSQYLIRNLEKGKNTEKLAGPTASSLLLDEAGKGDWLEALIAAEPAMRTPYGWRCLPLIIGTSGSFDKAKDLKNFREKLDIFNFIQMQVKDHTGTTVSFVPGYRSSLAERKKVRLSTHLGVKRGSELDVIPIYKVADPAREVKKINSEIALLENKNEFTLSKKKRMYYPEIEDHLFLTADVNNIFADLKQLAKDHLTYLNNTTYFEEYGWLEPGLDGVPKWTLAKPHEKPIMNFPMKEHESKDAPIIIWDHPIDTEDYGILHVGGTDPYNQDETAYSPSLGVTYIFRRMYDPINGKFQRQFVACYAARPTNMNKWYKQTKLLIEYYRATDLPENENKEFIRYFDERNSAHLLEDGFDLAKEINPFTKNTRKKGLSAALPNQKYGNGIFKEYCLEELEMGEGSDGEMVHKPGLVRIKDKVLLMEIIEYLPGMNVDRIVAARHALIIANSKDKFYKMAKVKKEPEPEKKKPKTFHTPFSTKRYGTFSGKRKNYF